MVRKMLYNCGHKVLELHRESYGPLRLGDLEVGRLCGASKEEELWAEGLAEVRRQGKKGCRGGGELVNAI